MGNPSKIGLKNRYTKRSLFCSEVYLVIQTVDLTHFRKTLYTLEIF